MYAAEIELYEILKPKIGEKEARTLLEYIETRVDRKLEEKKDVLATKQDIAYLKQDIANLEIKLEKTRADIIKWMFLFWIGQLASLIAILQIFFKR